MAAAKWASISVFLRCIQENSSTADQLTAIGHLAGHISGTSAAAQKEANQCLAGNNK
jgi:hypothetical protein